MGIRVHNSKRWPMVGDSAFVADTVVIDGRSEVLDEARVMGFVKLAMSKIMGSSIVEGDADLFRSEITDAAVVSGSARICSSSVKGAARVEGDVLLDHVVVTDNAVVYGSAVLWDDIRVAGCSRVFGKAKLSGRGFKGFSVNLVGECKFGGDATFEGLITPKDFVKKYGDDKVSVLVDDMLVVLTDVWDMG